MFKPASVFIGLRYFFAGQRSALLVSFISLLAIAGLVLGVALLIIVLSVMNGFDRELRDNILSVVPHVQLIHQSGIEDWQSERDNIMQMDSVTNAVPYADAEGLMSHRQNARPVQLLGLSPHHDAGWFGLGFNAVQLGYSGSGSCFDIRGYCGRAKC